MDRSLRKKMKRLEGLYEDVFMVLVTHMISSVCPLLKRQNENCCIFTFFLDFFIIISYRVLTKNYDLDKRC